MYGKRVHIVPVGDAVDRMITPVVEMRADVVYLLAHDPDGHNSGRWTPVLDGDEVYDSGTIIPDVSPLRTNGFDTTATATERLAEEGIEVNHKFVDQYDVYSVLGQVTTIAHNRPDEDTVAVNVSTGTRLATIGAALGRMDADTAVTAYHTSETTGETTTTSDDGVSPVPDYHLESPSRDALAAMAIVAVRDTEMYTPQKRDLIDWGLRLRDEADISLNYIDRIIKSYHDRTGATAPPTEFGDLDSDGQKGAYRSLRVSALDELRTREYLAIDDEQVGRADLVTLTPTGKAALRAFRHKILDVIRALYTISDAESFPAVLADSLPTNI